MTKKPDEHYQDISVTDEERQAIYERLVKRNQIRSQQGRPPLDIPSLYRSKVQQLADRKYNDAITPYLKHAYWQYPGGPGLPARLQQHTSVIDYAEKLAGISEPDKRPVNFVHFLDLYTNGKLPLA